MVLWAVNIIMAVVSNFVTIANANNVTVDHLPPLLPKTFKDIFLGTGGGKPTLGTTSATCWARGGVCVDIRECPLLRIDPAVAGCTRGFKVCCKSFKLSSPTVGIHRRQIPIYSPNLVELNGEAIKTMAANNVNLLLLIRDLPKT